VPALKKKTMAENENQSQTQSPPPNQPPPANSAPPPSSPENDARMWNMLCHMSALAGCLVPFGHILGPLVVWQIKKNQYPSVDVHGKASLNFQITVTIAVLVGSVAALVLSFFCIGYLLFPLVALIGLAGLVLAVIAGIKANNGEEYKYPWSLELVK
jgi:uncharacterized Tic20 family protein